jgi:chromosomal replication initiator protein
MTPVRKIQQATAAFYDIPVDQLRGRSRLRRFAEARQVAMYLAKNRTAHSYPALGSIFGRDHTTVLHAVVKVEKTERLKAAAAAIDMVIG